MKFPLHKILCAMLLVLYVASVNLLTVPDVIVQEQGVNGQDITYEVPASTSDHVLTISLYVILSILIAGQIAASFLNKEKVVLYMTVFLFSISFIGLLPLFLESLHGYSYLLKEVPWQYYCFVVLQAVLLITTDTKTGKKADNQ